MKKLRIIALLFLFVAGCVENFIRPNTAQVAKLINIGIEAKHLAGDKLFKPRVKKVLASVADHLKNSRKGHLSFVMLFALVKEKTSIDRQTAAMIEAAFYAGLPSSVKTQVYQPEMLDYLIEVVNKVQTGIGGG